MTKVAVTAKGSPPKAHQQQEEAPLEARPDQVLSGDIDRSSSPANTDGKLVLRGAANSPLSIAMEIIKRKREWERLESIVSSNKFANADKGSKKDPASVSYSDNATDDPLREKQPVCGTPLLSVLHQGSKGEISKKNRNAALQGTGKDISLGDFFNPSTKVTQVERPKFSLDYGPRKSLQERQIELNRQAKASEAVRADALNFASKLDAINMVYQLRRGDDANLTDDCDSNKAEADDSSVKSRLIPSVPAWALRHLRPWQEDYLIDIEPGFFGNSEHATKLEHFDYAKNRTHNKAWPAITKSATFDLDDGGDNTEEAVGSWSEKEWGCASEGVEDAGIQSLPKNPYVKTTTHPSKDNDDMGWTFGHDSWASTECDELGKDPWTNTTWDSLEGPLWGGVPQAPKSSDINVSFWITINSGGQTFDVPIRGHNVSGREKAIATIGMEMIWEWVHEKKLSDKISLREAYELAESMYEQHEKMRKNMKKNKTEKAKPQAQNGWGWA